MKVTEPRIKLRRCRYCGAIILDDETGAWHELTCTTRLKRVMIP